MILAPPGLSVSAPPESGRTPRQIQVSCDRACRVSVRLAADDSAAVRLVTGRGRAPLLPGRVGDPDAHRRGAGGGPLTDPCDGVDLNRDFPTRDWGSAQAVAPAPAAASEPKTRARIALIRDLRPAQIVTVHAPLGLVEGPRRGTLVGPPRTRRGAAVGARGGLLRDPWLARGLGRPSWRSPRSPSSSQWSPSAGMQQARWGFSPRPSDR